MDAVGKSISERDELRQSLHVAYGFEGCTVFARMPYQVNLERDYVDLPSDAATTDEVDGVGGAELRL